MSASLGVVYPLWDYQQAPQRLDALAGAAPIHHLTIPVVTGPVRRLRLTDDGGVEAFQSEGGWHFPPEKSRYHRPPPVASWVGKRNPLKHLCAAAAERGLAVQFEVDVRGAGELCERSPHLRQRSAFGEEAASAGACPSHPETKALLETLVEELAGYGPEAIQIVEWRPHLACDRLQPRPLDWRPQARRLCDLCFCVACRETADQDAAFRALAQEAGTDGAERSAIVSIRRCLAEDVARGGVGHEGPTLLPAPAGRDPVPAGGEPVLTAYIEATQRACAEWLGRLAGRLERVALWHAVRKDAMASATDPSRLLALDGDRLARKADEAVVNLGKAAGVRLSAWMPVNAHASDLTRHVKQLQTAGAELIDFEGLTEAPPECVEWLRQAARYAHRER